MQLKSHEKLLFQTRKFCHDKAGFQGDKVTDENSEKI